tara:strand:- start:24 stop:401 length:378 start_codon:yes stop_codon:yes gene_type:complete
MKKRETKLWLKLKSQKCKIIWTRIENSAAHGTPDVLGYNQNHIFFTVELKVKWSEKISFSPHQIAFHFTHPKRTFILVEEQQKVPGPSAIKLYEGTAVHALVGGAHPPHVACGLSACCLLLENLT